ncbi:MAG: YjbQ family protein [Parcubacteria group bacterium]|nr:YjbQ family protein [Parcubacteria group bacterium]
MFLTATLSEEATVLIKKVMVRIAVDQHTRYANITDILKSFVDTVNVDDGELFVHSMHTTCAIVCQEDETQLLTNDLPRILERVAPTSIGRKAMMRENRGAYYAHDDKDKRTENLVAGEEERVNGHAHIRATLVGAPNLQLAIANGNLVLGTWQSVNLVDFDDQGNPPAKERNIFIRLISWSEKKPEQSLWFIPFRWPWRRQ